MKKGSPKDGDEDQKKQEDEKPKEKTKGDGRRDDKAPKDGVDSQRKHKRSEDNQKTMNDAAKSSGVTSMEIVPFVGTPEKKKRKTDKSGASTTASSGQENKNAKQNIKDASHDKRGHNGAPTGCSPEKKKLKFDECSSEDEACLWEWFHLCGCPMVIYGVLSCSEGTWTHDD